MMEDEHKHYIESSPQCKTVNIYDDTIQRLGFRENKSEKQSEGAYRKENSMDRSKPLSDFFTAIRNDGRIGITHIAIYAALLQFRIDRGFVNPIQAFGQQIMRIAKISAPITYHKCVKELSEYGYIVYIPSFKRNQGSKIYFPQNI